MPSVERARYLAHARLPIFKRRVERSMALAREMLDASPGSYISISFGKDSLVMTHLLLTLVDSSLPVVYVNCGEYDEWPDTQDVRNAFVAKTGCRLTEIPGQSIADFYRQAGFVVAPDMLGEIPEVDRLDRQYNRSLVQTADGYAKSAGYTGVFVGLRKEESWQRYKMLSHRSPVYYAETRGMWMCHPLAEWRGADVWAWVVSHDLPYPHLYDIHPNGREKARNGAMMGDGSFCMDRLPLIRSLYPEVWMRFIAEFPEIARLT